MDATTTAFNGLLKQLRTDFPELHFAASTYYYWSSDENTVYYDESSPGNTPLLLHEASHGILSHSTYTRDIDLIKLEREAWTKAEELGRRYGVPIDAETREDALDSYRDWLHARSLCPHCQHNGIQTDQNTYECVVCSVKWHVNEAKQCGLRRILTT